MTETWLPVKGYEGLYEVSDRGRVRSLDRITMRSGRPMRLTGKTLAQGKTGTHGKGKTHRNLSLFRDGKGRSKSVHRLVLEAFVGPCPPGMEACHYDDVGSNNNLANLRWDTHSANVIDSFRNGRPRTAPAGSNVRHTHCKQGHEFTPENTYTYNPKQQVCKACSLEWQRRKRARRRLRVS